MSARPPCVHRLRGNETEWTPPCLVALDTESRWELAGTTERHTLRLWSALATIRRGSSRAVGSQVWGRGTTTEELCDYLEALMVGRDTVWVTAHNLGFDLALTRLPEALTRRGWEASDDSLNPDSPWLRLRRNERRLTFVDSFTWLPVRLAAVGELVGVDKPELPENDDSEDAWQARCDGDVTILSAAMLALMEWFDRARLGRWSLTGPATGYNVLRHRRDFPKMVIDPDQAARSFERRAIYGGRREAYRIGEYGPGRFFDLDIHGAYPMVAATRPLPTERLTAFPSLLMRTFDRLPGSFGVIAECVVRRAACHVPVRLHDEVWYPRGAVRTVLATPEIKHALTCGCEVDIGPGYLYRTAKWGRGWARWVMRLADGDDPRAPAVARVTGKHWSRAVLGKFAQRTSRVEPAGPARGVGWRVEDGYDAAREASYVSVELGGQRFDVYRDQEGDNSFPAVLAFIESYVRVQLDRLVRELPCGRAVQVDTDGVLVETDDPDAVREWAQREVGVELRCKTAATRVHLLGPQHVWLDDQARLSGVPRDALREGDQTYVGRTWPGLAWQLAQSGEAAYLRPEVRVTVRGPFTHRWVRRDGSTSGVECAVRRGRTVLLPPTILSGDASPAGLADEQHHVLSELRSRVLARQEGARTRAEGPQSVQTRRRGVKAANGHTAASGAK